MSQNAIIDLGELSKPATTLIRKVSAAVGGLFEPYQRVRLAKADVKADLIRAEGEIRVTELHRRAVQRFVEEEALHQQNMEATAAKAVPLLADEARPEEIARRLAAALFWEEPQRVERANAGALGKDFGR